MQCSRVVTDSFVHFIDVSIERECTIDGDTETLNAFSYNDWVAAKCNSIPFCFMSHTGADVDSLWNRWSLVTNHLVHTRF